MCFLHMNYIYTVQYIYIIYIIYILREWPRNRSETNAPSTFGPAELNSHIRPSRSGCGLAWCHITKGNRRSIGNHIWFIHIYIYILYIYVYIYMICICCIDLFLSGVNSMILISIDILHGHGRKNWTIFKSHSKSAFTPQHISDL